MNSLLNSRISSKVVKNRRNVAKIVIVRLVTGTLYHSRVLCVGDVVKEDISVVSALPLVGSRQKDTDIHFQVKIDVATVPPSILRTYRVVRNTLQWILESMYT